MERRRHKRYVKRVKVRFGDGDLSSNGFTANVSEGGLFIVATPSVKVGQRLHVQFDLAPRPDYTEVVVARLALVPPELRSAIKGGFGVRYLTPRELMADLVPSAGGARTHTIAYETAWALAQAYDKELRRGGVFLWSEQAETVDAVLPVEFDLVWANQAVQLNAKVVTVVPGPDGRHGLALMFVDGPSAANQFVHYLPK